MSTDILIKLYDESDPYPGSLDCWVTEPGQPQTSFDPDQIPAKLKTLLTPTKTAALASKAVADAERDEWKAKAEAAETARQEAEDRFAAVNGANVESLRAEMTAKDANIQALLEQLASR